MLAFFTFMSLINSMPSRVEPEKCILTSGPRNLKKHGFIHSGEKPFSCRQGSSATIWESKTPHVDSYKKKNVSSCWHAHVSKA